MHDSQEASPRPQDSQESSPTREMTCGECGTNYIAKSLACPFCTSRTGKIGDEVTHKVLDAPDLVK